MAALAAKAGRSKPTHSEDEETNEGETKKSISFRNYAPKDASMEQEEDEEEGSAKKKMRTEETKTSALQEALQAAQSEIAAGPAKDQTSTGVTSMAPKKVNWDLKRDVEKRLAKLERRTQRAIVELLKERLEREANEQASGDDSSDLD